MPVGSRGVLLNSVEPSSCATDSGFRLLSLDPVNLLSTGRRTAAVGAYLEVFLVTWRNARLFRACDDPCMVL